MRKIGKVEGKSASVTPKMGTKPGDKEGEEEEGSGLLEADSVTSRDK